MTIGVGACRGRELGEGGRGEGGGGKEGEGGTGGRGGIEGKEGVEGGDRTYCYGTSIINFAISYLASSFLPSEASENHTF